MDPRRASRAAAGRALLPRKPTPRGTGALAALRLLDADAVATASGCRHTLPAEDDPRPPRTGDGRGWASTWEVFEHFGP
ncbi:MAG: hypothetical protein ACRDT6_19790 [Micromonosporaceae bacterium]